MVGGGGGGGAAAAAASWEVEYRKGDDAGPTLIPAGRQAGTFVGADPGGTQLAQGLVVAVVRNMEGHAGVGVAMVWEKAQAAELGTEPVAAAWELGGPACSPSAVCVRVAFPVHLAHTLPSGPPSLGGVEAEAAQSVVIT